MQAVEPRATLVKTYNGCATVETPPADEEKYPEAERPNPGELSEGAGQVPR